MSSLAHLGLLEVVRVHSPGSLPDVTSSIWGQATESFHSGALMAAIAFVIKYIQKTSPYSAYLFVKAPQQTWRTHGKKLKSIRKRHHINPGDSTSYHITPIRPHPTSHWQTHS
eukprot:15343087-Ditylum_brightwellii.AAC.2